MVKPDLFKTSTLRRPPGDTQLRPHVWICSEHLGEWFIQVLDQMMERSRRNLRLKSILLHLLPASVKKTESVRSSWTIFCTTHWIGAGLTNFLCPKFKLQPVPYTRHNFLQFIFKVLDQNNSLNFLKIQPNLVFAFFHTNSSFLHWVLVNSNQTTLFLQCFNTNLIRFCGQSWVALGGRR